MPGAPRFRRTRLHAASTFRRSQICPHRLCHFRRFSSFFKPDAPVSVRISSAPAALGVFPVGSSLDSLCLLMRPSPLASPFVPPPFAPSLPFWSRVAPSTYWRQVTRHYPRFLTTTGSCVTSQGFGLQFRFLLYEPLPDDSRRRTLTRPPRVSAFDRYGPVLSANTM